MSVLDGERGREKVVLEGVEALWDGGGGGEPGNLEQSEAAFVRGGEDAGEGRWDLGDLADESGFDHDGFEGGDVEEGGISERLVDGNGKAGDF